MLTAGRFAIRYRTMHKLQLDDALHGLAALFLIAHITTFTIAFPLICSLAYSLVHIELGVDDAKPPSASDINRSNRLGVAVTVTLWFTIYLVKFSFLAFYRKLFGVFREFMIAWWIVLAFTVATFLANFIALFWCCGAPKDLYNPSKLASSLSCRGA